MAVVAAGFQPTIKATMPAPSLSNNIGDLKGLAKRRMRTSDGKRAASKADIEKDIVKLLEHAMTPSQLAQRMNRDPKELYRSYLKPMLQKGVLEKQGDYYKRAGVAEVVVAKEQFDDIISRSAFANLPIMADLVKHCGSLGKGKGDMQWVTGARKICTGKMLPEFKCRPEHWNAETTTPEFLAAWRAHFNKERLPGQLRQLVRYFHEYVLKKPITEAQKELWGLDGEKDDAGIYNHVKLTTAQIHALTNFYLNKGDLETAAYVAAGIEMFGRPEAMFMAATGTMTLTPRTLEYATVAGSTKQNWDPIAVDQMRIIAALHPGLAQVHTFHQRRDRQIILIHDRHKVDGL